MSVSRKPTQWRCYKPKKEGNGAASRLELKVVSKEVVKADKKYNLRQVQVFWVSALESGKDANGNAKFGWEDGSKSVTLKLGEADIGELLAVLTGAKPNAGGDKGLFHQNPKGNTTFSFTFNAQYKNYSIRIAKKIGTVLTAVSHTITVGEAQILRILLEQAVKQTYQW